MFDVGKCDYNDVDRTAPKQDCYICHDSFLGLMNIPSTLLVLLLVSDYDLFNCLLPVAFLNKYRLHGNWEFPRVEGCRVDLVGIPIMGNMILPKGYTVCHVG